MVFQPGKSGNPGGRPRIATAELAESARLQGTKCIDKLVKIIETSEDEKAIIAAIKELLDRGYGKALASVEHSGEIATTPQVATINVQIADEKE